MNIDDRPTELRANSHILETQHHNLVNIAHISTEYDTEAKNGPTARFAIKIHIRLLVGH